MAAVAVIAGLFGLVIGSFLNVVVYRVPLGRSIVSPPSACPQCGAGIRGFDNVPVLSWLLLRGKCRDCGAPISARYPLVELGTGILFAAVGWWLSAPVLESADAAATVASALILIAFCYFAAITVALGLIDLDVHSLPNVIVLPSYLVAGVLFTTASVLSGDFSGLIRAGIGMAGLFAAYLLMALAWPGGMGLGDVKLAGVIGIYLGWIGWGALAVGAFAAFLLAGVYAVGLLATKRADRKGGIPFGPWMLAGAWVGCAVGTAAFTGYLSLFGLTA